MALMLIKKIKWFDKDKDDDKLTINWDQTDLGGGNNEYYL